MLYYRQYFQGGDYYDAIQSYCYRDHYHPFLGISGNWDLLHHSLCKDQENSFSDRRADPDICFAWPFSVLCIGSIYSKYNDRIRSSAYFNPLIKT